MCRERWERVKHSENTPLFLLPTAEDRKYERHSLNEAFMSAVANCHRFGRPIGRINTESGEKNRILKLLYKIN